MASVSDSQPELNGRSERGGRSANEDAPDEEPAGELPGAIQWIGDQFEKMLLGIPKFLFVIFPRWLWQWLRETLPTAMQTLRMVTLAVVWTAVAFGPLALSHDPDRLPDPIRNALDAAPPAGPLVWGWTLVAVAGSVYGLLYVVLKRRQLRKAAKAGRSGSESDPVQPKTGPQPSPSPDRTPFEGASEAVSPAGPQWGGRQPGAVALRVPSARPRRGRKPAPPQDPTGR